jgi:predicted ATPase with chaperone activity
VVVNLAPADIKKEGSAFDLPIAIGMLIAEGVLTQEMAGGFLIVGELSLDGRLKPVRGALSMAVLAKKAGYRGMVIPADMRRRRPSWSRSRLRHADPAAGGGFLTGNAHAEPCISTSRAPSNLLRVPEVSSR